MSCKSWDSYSDNNKSKPKRPKENELMTDKQKIILYKKAIKEIEIICVTQNLKYDTTACEVLDIIDKLFEALK